MLLKKIKYCFRIVIATVSLFFSVKLTAQECACGEKTAIGLYAVDWSSIQKPDDKVLLEQWQKLGYPLSSELAYQFDMQLKSNCFFQVQLGKGTQPHSFATVWNYIIYGLVMYKSGDYILKLWMQPSCSDKILAETDVKFQLYPVLDIDRVTQQAVAQFIPLLKVIDGFESKERASKNYGFGGDIWGGKITILPINNVLRKGEETEVFMQVRDCDGEILRNKEISTQGTTGGVFTPAKFKTNAKGEAKTKFKLTSDKEALLKAQCETKNVWGCQDLYTGTEIINLTKGGYRVNVGYKRMGSETINANTDEDAIALSAHEDKLWEVLYVFELFYSPLTPPKDGEQIIVFPQFENAEGMPKNGKTVVMTNMGSSMFNISNKPMELLRSPVGAPLEKEKTEIQTYNSNSPLPPSVSFTFKNNELVFFSAGVEFPEAEDGLNPVGGSFSLNHEFKGFPVKPKKVTDPKSQFKWVYEFEYNNKEGYAQQNKLMKQGKKDEESAIIQIWKTF